MAVCARNLNAGKCLAHNDSPTEKDCPMPIMREWRAEVRRALKDEYVAYVKATGISSYKQTPGNLAAIVATRDIDAERAEILTLSWWQDEA
jgi:hypothetical protein